MALVPTIDRGRETALPSPLYHSGAAGIDIISVFAITADEVIYNNESYG